MSETSPPAVLATEGPAAGNVVALNEQAAVFDALAREIRGSAAGWPSGALSRLEQALLERYGHHIGGEAAVQRLMMLAQESAAA